MEKVFADQQTEDNWFKTHCDYPYEDVPKIIRLSEHCGRIKQGNFAPVWHGIKKEIDERVQNDNG